MVKKQFHRLFGLKNIYMHSIGMGVHQSVQVVILGVKLLYFFWRYSSEPHIINVTNSFGKSNDPPKKKDLAMIHLHRWLGAALVLDGISINIPLNESVFCLNSVILSQRRFLSFYPQFGFLK
jgi:hypothetical protein